MNLAPIPMCHLHHEMIKANFASFCLLCLAEKNILTITYLTLVVLPKTFAAVASQVSFLAKLR